MKVRCIALALLLAFCCVVAMPPTVRAQEPPGEYQVKAAFLYNFAKFIEWPADTQEETRPPLVVAVLGHDHFGSYLDALRGKTVRGRRLVVRRFRRLENLERCDLLFVSSSERPYLPRILQRSREWNTLTVSDMEGFGQAGGVITFMQEGNKVRFQINLDAALRSGLKVNAKLLSVAKSFSGNSQE